MSTPVIIATWTDNGAFAPLARFAKECDKHFCVGERYKIETVEERSQRSHSHFFAWLHDAWLSLPDDRAMDFPTSEHLRKHALILTGHRDERKLVASSVAEARKIAAFLRPADEYAIISVHGNVVVEWKAKSQSKKAMGGPTFQKSKQDVMDFVSDMLRIETRERSAA